MNQGQIFNLLYLVVFTLVIVGVLGVLFGVWRLIRPAARSRAKLLPYECGMEQMTAPWGRFHVRYYYFGLLFVLFDVETVLLFAVATQFRSMRTAWMQPFIAAAVFVLLVFGALVYAWRKGALEWR